MVKLVCPTFEIVPGFEVSVCECPKILLRELRHVFPAQSFDIDSGSLTSNSKDASIEPAQSDSTLGDDADPVPSDAAAAVEGMPSSSAGRRVIAVATMQQADVELAAYADVVDSEKDRLLLSFMAFASDLSKRLLAAGHWVDYIDPCSGLPMVEQSNNTYSEVDGMQTLLNYRVQNAGCCKIILHPRWGAAVYPATLFTAAPGEVVVAALRDMQAALEQRTRGELP